MSGTKPFLIRGGAAKKAMEDDSGVPAVDRRSMVDQQIEAVKAQLSMRLDATLARAKFEADDTTKQRLVTTITQIDQHFTNMKREAVNIGRALCRIRDVSEKVYDAIVREGILPFEWNVAYKLRRIGEALEGRIEGRVVSEEMLPKSYAAAYELIALPNDGYHEAVTRGLLSPKTKFREVLHFKAELRERRDQQKINTETDTEKYLRLKSLLDGKERRAQELNDQLRTLEREIRELRQQLDSRVE